MSIPRCKFSVNLSIKELANLPHTNGTVFVKWFLKDSPKPDARGRTSHVKIEDHKVIWNYDAQSNIRIGTDKTNTLRASLLVCDVLWEQDSSSRISLGKVELNMAEYVKRDHKPYTYLLKNSKVNCILSIALSLTQIKGPSDYNIPKFTAPQIRSDLAGFMDEKRKNDDVINEGLVWRLHNTFQVEWDPRPWYLSPRACVEDIFKGGDGFGKDYWEKHKKKERQLAEIKDKEDVRRQPKILKESVERDNFQSWLLDMS